MLIDFLETKSSSVLGTQTQAGHQHGLQWCEFYFILIIFFETLSIFLSLQFKNNANENIKYYKKQCGQSIKISEFYSTYPAMVAPSLC